MVLQISGITTEETGQVSGRRAMMVLKISGIKAKKARQVSGSGGEDKDSFQPAVSLAHYRRIAIRTETRWTFVVDSLRPLSWQLWTPGREPSEVKTEMFALVMLLHDSAVIIVSGIAIIVLVLYLHRRDPSAEGETPRHVKFNHWHLDQLLGNTRGCGFITGSGSRWKHRTQGSSYKICSLRCYGLPVHHG